MVSIGKLILEYEDTLVGQLVALTVIAAASKYVLDPFLHKLLLDFHSQKQYWKDSLQRPSHFGPPASKELLWNSVSCVKHFLAGSFMMAGWFLGQGDPNRLILFRMGVIFEVAFELLDIIDMARGTGSWKDPHHQINKAAKWFVLAHHLPGIALVFPLNLWCSCVEQWQRCAIGLEVGGGIGLLLACLRESFQSPASNNRSLRQCLQLLTVSLGSVFFFFWARFLIVTPAMYEIIVGGLEIHCKTTYALIVAAILMTLFNLGALLTYLSDVWIDASSMISVPNKMKAA